MSVMLLSYNIYSVHDLLGMEGGDMTVSLPGSDSDIVIDFGNGGRNYDRFITWLYF